MILQVKLSSCQLLNDNDTWWNDDKSSIKIKF